MCGRFRNHRDPAKQRAFFDIRAPAFPNFAPNYNAAPSQSLPVVRFNPETKERSLDLLRWGLVPIWAKDLATGFKAINARAETVETSGLFRDAYKSRRALIPADGFYEWKTIDAKARLKQPYSFALADGGLFAFAGLWERWRSPDGEWVRTFTIITGEPNALVAPVHNRMPVILPVAAYPAWLGETPATAEQLRALLAPYPAELMRAWPVSPDVGNVKNNHPGLIEALNSA
jgi:putative SOS response-associated peptidase YedK